MYKQQVFSFLFMLKSLGCAFFSRLRTSLIDLLSPPCCYSCKMLLPHREVFCAECFAKLQPIVSFKLPVTTKHSVKVFAAAAYHDPIKYLILAKGWSDNVASVCLGELMWKMTDVRNAEFDYIVPVPLHWTRYAKRGFNQAEEISKVLAKKSGKKVAKLLKRAKRTKFQSLLPSTLRISNVHEAFSLSVKDPSTYQGKHLLLVDDLMTTGSTIRFAAKTLLQLKPASITAVVASRVISW